MAKLILGAAFILAGALMMVIAGVAKSQGGRGPPPASCGPFRSCWR